MGDERTKELESIWTGNDSELLKIIIPLYCQTGTELIVDATAGSRVMWKGVKEFKPVFCDIDHCKNPDIVTHWEDLHNHIKDADLIIFDPPHWPTTSGSNNFNNRYGLKKMPSGPGAAKLSFDEFFPSARESIKKGGCVFVKTCDLVNGGRNHWSSLHAIDVAENNGFTLVDWIIKIRKSYRKSSTWKNQIHARKVHSHWLIFREGKGWYKR